MTASPRGAASTVPRPTVPAISPVDPGSPSAVAHALSRHLDCSAGYRQAPEPICWGWETYTYRLCFNPVPELPAGLTGPMVLRIYASAQGTPRARHEFAVQKQLWRLGFPVPRPVHLECDNSLFGGPFFLMECIPGSTIFHALVCRPWQLWTGPGHMAELHARLHSLPIDGLGLSPGSFLSRRLDEIETLIARHDLYGLRAGLDWLADRRPSPARIGSLLHLDWHPLNLIRRPDGSLAALDWSEADVGDPHADVAMACLLLDCAPVACSSWWQTLSVPVGRPVIAWRYLSAYRRLMPLDEQRLSYFRAWAILRRLANYGRWLRAGPASTGSKPTVLQHLHEAHLDDLTRCFRRLTSVAVSL
jgi:aminoglycoside phosphotransferase (APT) family kinase protein